MSSILNVDIQGKIIGINQLLDKGLYAAADVPLYRDINLFYKGQKGVYTAKAGEYVGKIYGTVQKNGNDLWWQFYDSKEQPYWAKHNPNSFSLTKLVQQNVKTLPQETAAAARKENSTVQNIFSDLFSTKNLLIVGGVFLLSQVIKKKL